jgi:hypothetical protein
VSEVLACCAPREDLQDLLPKHCACGLVNRDVDDADAKNPHREQEEWEKHQISAATMTYGAKDKKAVNPEYDFVFEDQIDFVKTEALAGTLVRSAPAREQTAAPAAHPLFFSDIV